MTNYCIKCWEKNRNPLLKYCSNKCIKEDWIIYVNWKMVHLSESGEVIKKELKIPTMNIEHKKPKLKEKNLIDKKVYKKVKANAIARFNGKIKKEIFKRQNWICIISWKKITDYHHVFFWIQANRWKNRNEVTQWVGLHYSIHHEIHHWVEWKWDEYRRRCIEYIFETYTETDIWLKKNNYLHNFYERTLYKNSL